MLQGRHTTLRTCSLFLRLQGVANQTDRTQRIYRANTGKLGIAGKVLFALAGHLGPQFELSETQNDYKEAFGRQNDYKRGFRLYFLYGLLVIQEFNL